MLFSRRLSDTEIGAYLDNASPYELAMFVSSFVLWDSLTDKGKVHAAAASTTSSGSGPISSREAAFLSDLVKAHRRVQQQV